MKASRALLALAAVAVAFAAADTYVVVLALPDMLGSVGYSTEELQRAAPIISGFLLGYVAMLPLIGRIADLRGRVPVVVAALVIFALGSLVTALSYDMTSMVAAWCLPPSRWSRTSTPSSGAPYPSGSCRRCRKRAA
jgi:MFS family permease